MTSLLFRVDAGTQIGTGHVMRCLALAQAWQAEGGRAVFLSDCESEVLCRRIETAGIGFIPLNAPHPDPADLQETLASLEELGAAWLVLDGYHFAPTYQQAVREAGYRLLVIDDTAHWPEYHADILLNQNIYASALAYVCDPNTTLLLGTRYVLLRPEFLVWRGWQREISGVARRALVTLGGSDPDNVTLKAVRALQQIDGLETVVIVGGSNPHHAQLQAAVSDARCNMRMVHNPTNVPELMAWADVAVSASGSTCWELAFMGLPGVLIVLALNQQGVAIELERQGVAVNLHEQEAVDAPAIASAVRELLPDRGRRQEMCARGRQLVDGYGALRVVNAMCGGQ
jgi:UDP-2,4-diacetamido-2,4,6-trideoxy-beta-L-altropyranose hydrolase